PTIVTTTTTLATTTTVVTTTTIGVTTTTMLSLKFTSGSGTTSCGSAGFNPSAASEPFSGEIDSNTGGTTKITDLGLACLYVGGGKATVIPPGATPAGALSYLNVQGTNLVASNGTG